MSASSHLIRVHDNFYSDPAYVREEALAARYCDHSSEDGTSFGSSSLFAFLPCDIHERVCKAFGFERIALLPPDVGTGCFYHTFGEGPSKEDFLVHRDGDKNPGTPEFALLIYLTPSAPRESGTGIYQHKQTKIWKEVTEADAARLGSSVDELEEILDCDVRDKTKWDVIGFADNIFNRAVIYPSHWLHCGRKYFGENVEHGRLYHMFFIHGWPDVFAGIDEENDALFHSGNGSVVTHG